MSEYRTKPALLFISGLLILVLGIGLALVTTAVPGSGEILGQTIPYQVEIHPYLLEGLGLIFLGFVIMLVGRTWYIRDLKKAKY